MAQWEKLMQLDSGYLQQLDELYDRDSFPMEVRHYLATWIENQEWERATQDHDLALVLLQVLLENLDIQHSRFNQEEESFLKQHNMRRFKHYFQNHEHPCALAGNILWFLGKEKEILQSADLSEQVQRLHVEQNPMETDSQRNLERLMAGLRNKLQCMEHMLVCLEEQQDEFDFKYKTQQMEGKIDKAVKAEQMKVLQILLNTLNNCRKAMLLGLKELLKSSEELQGVLVSQELVEWRRRQQRACIGAPDTTCLDQLEKWFTCVAECLFQVRTFLKKLEELVEKVTYEGDPVKAETPALQKRVNSLLTSLLQSAFVVETQPSMPQGKGPLVLRTNVQFSVKTRLLVKFPELNHSMKVNMSMDRETTKAQVKGYRRFNVLGTSSKVLNMAESKSGGMVTDFRHLTLKEQKSGGGKISLSVTEELHIIYFDTVFELHGFSVDLEASSLPVVIISNSSQQQSAWASILWFNMLCDTKDVGFFSSCPTATWPLLGEMLSWQFLSLTTRGLEPSQLDMIAYKFFGKREDYSACEMSWSKFSKENAANVNFSLWVWFDGILVLVKTYLEDLWRDGSIMGFVSRSKEKSLLKKKQRGTFLIRFSESVRDGGVTYSWVDYTTTGEAEVNTVKPFTRNDLSQIPFHEIIRHYQIQETGNIPEYKLLFLYPNTPKDEAFGKYYSKETGDQSHYSEYIKRNLMFVSKENTPEAKSPLSSDMSEDVGLAPLNGICDEAVGLDGDLLLPLLVSVDPESDPMLCGTLPDLEDLDLLRYLDNPNTYLPDCFLGDDEQAFPEALHQLTGPLLLPCGDPCY